jgi:hypothetical protein
VEKGEEDGLRRQLGCLSRSTITDEAAHVGEVEGGEDVLVEEDDATGEHDLGP